MMPGTARAWGGFPAKITHSFFGCVRVKVLGRGVEKPLAFWVPLAYIHPNCTIRNVGDAGDIWVEQKIIERVKW